MEEINPSYFYAKIFSNKRRYPSSGQIELTYRCNLNCVYCFCKGYKEENKELSTIEWKKIIREIHKEGCFSLIFTGGEPLMRDDFLELYLYAKQKGFIITIFTNGQLLTGPFWII